jgi:hypothetical protein
MLMFKIVFHAKIAKIFNIFEFYRHYDQSEVISNITSSLPAKRINLKSIIHITIMRLLSCSLKIHYCI